MRRRLVLLLCLIAAVSMVVDHLLADHLPEKLLAHGKPEVTLAGINLQTTTLDQVLQKYGPPTKTVNAPNNPDWTGYLWQKGDLRLEVEASHSKGKVYLDRISIVRTGAAASASSDSESTGGGLRLGDGLDALKRIYGTRFQLSRQQTVPPDTEPFLSVPGSRTATVQWTPIDFTLTAGLDQQGHIVAMRLNLPECYPGGCQ